MSARAWPLAVVLLVACRRPDLGLAGASGPGSSASVPAGPLASAPASMSAPVAARVGPSAPPTGSAQVAPPAGPAASGSASPAEREATLALLLSGRMQAGQLPEEATAPGYVLEPGLRKRLTQVEVEVEPESGPLSRTDPRKPVPLIRRGTMQVVGPLPPEVIQRIVSQNIGRFRLCYEKALAARPTTEGTMAVTLVISPEGALTSARTLSSTVSEGMANCITSSFRHLEFPRSESVVTVTYPLTFELRQ